MIKRIQTLFVIVCFGCNLGFPSFSFASSQTILNLPAPGSMLSTSSAFAPAMVKGIQIDPKNPLKFNFIVDTGDTNLTGEKLKEESAKLIKYFLAALTVPEKDLWVNLSPYEKDRIIAQGLGQTEMGRDMLSQDYILKQLTASLIYPENGLGKAFWAKVYSQARQKYGTTNIPVNTFNKVWIMPDHATIYEHNGTAYVLENKLKVMLEEDYLSLQKHSVIQKNTVILSETKDLNKINSIRDSSATPQNDVNALGSQIVREMVLPQLEKEVNQGRNFANLRQIADAVVLATWYKQNLMNSLLGQVYANQNKIKGVDVADKNIKMKIYQQYLQAFKKGAYNYIKEDVDPVTNTTVPRKYFSGGETLIDYDTAMTTVHEASPEQLGSKHNFRIEAYIPALSSDAGMNNAMTADDVRHTNQLLDEIEESFDEIWLTTAGISASQKVQLYGSLSKLDGIAQSIRPMKGEDARELKRRIGSLEKIIKSALGVGKTDFAMTAPAPATPLIFNKTTPEQERLYKVWDRTLGNQLMLADGDFMRDGRGFKLGPKAVSAVENTIQYFNSKLFKGSQEQRYFYEWVLGQPSSLLSAFVLASLGLKAYEPFFLEKLRDIALNKDPFGNPRSAAREIREMAKYGTIGGKYQVSAKTQLDAINLLKDKPELYDLAKPQPRPYFSNKLKGKLFMQRNEPTEEQGFFRMGGWRGARITSKGIFKLIHNGELSKKLQFQFAASADLTRNIDTTEAFREGHRGIPSDYARVWELRDKSYGFITSFNRDDAARLYGDSYEFWRKDSAGRPPGGESYEDVKERVYPYVVNEIVPRLERGENVFISANGNSMRAIVEILGENTDKAYELDVKKKMALESLDGLEIGMRFDPVTSKPVEYWAAKDDQLKAAVDALAGYSHNSAMTAERKYDDTLSIRIEKEYKAGKAGMTLVTVTFMRDPQFRPFLKGFLRRPVNEEPVETAQLIVNKMSRVRVNLKTSPDQYYGLPLMINSLSIIGGDNAAMLTAVVPPTRHEGGINLDPAMNSIRIERDGSTGLTTSGNGMPLPVWQQTGRMINVGGFGVEIMSVTPIKDLPVFLGAAK